MTAAAISTEEQLVEDIASFTYDPLGYALYAFPWERMAQSWRMPPGPESGRLMHFVRYAITSRTPRHVTSR
ncbi:Uncharacterised protein [Salmonella enterica subsp. enterica]|uniref:Uncharacterized protein n=1 Tax=Salmonella enterica I TaxID=59201 RepID=A0A379W5A1_SALET|nr:Uncharacterised protein [Salmonella enterica subsp. enterica]